MLKVKNLTKIYNTNFKTNVGCENISFEVKTGEVVSLLGLNGAGKSSILNMLSMYLSPTTGDAYINEYSITNDSIKVKNLIGVLYEQNPLYTTMIVEDFLLFSANMHGLSTTAKTRVNDICNFWEIDGVRKQTINTLSKGFKQRVGLAKAMVHNPKLLILDEPTAGLDTIQIKEFEKKILQLTPKMSILFSTHNLLQAERICNKHILLDKGKIIAQGSLEELENKIKIAIEQNVTLNDLKANNSILEKSFEVFANINPNKFDWSKDA